jgi:hypothetical protein
LTAAWTATNTFGPLALTAGSRRITRSPSRKWTRPAGGHFVYYHAAEDYGALAVAALDETLEWAGACTSRFEGKSAKGFERSCAAVPAVAKLPDGARARAENRRVRNPLLVEVGPGRKGESRSCVLCG